MVYHLLCLPCFVKCKFCKWQFRDNIPRMFTISYYFAFYLGIASLVKEDCSKLLKVVIRILASNTLLDHCENAFCGLFLELVRTDSKLCRKLGLSFQAKRATFHLTFVPPPTMLNSALNYIWAEIVWISEYEHPTVFRCYVSSALDKREQNGLHIKEKSYFNLCVWHVKQYILVKRSVM